MCGQKELGKFHVAKRGSSIAFCGFMPCTAMLRNNCTIDVHCVSPPGVPNGIKSFPSLNAIAGFGVSRGRFQGSRQEG